jgi:hypothetical protein
MSPSKPGARSADGVTEVKLLLTAGSLAATLLGWGALAVRTDASQDVDPIDAPPPAVPPAFAFLADPLPTVVVPAGGAGAAAAADPSPGASLRSVDAPPPVQIITISKPSSGNSSRGGGGGGRTRSS